MPRRARRTARRPTAPPASPARIRSSARSRPCAAEHADAPTSGTVERRAHPEAPVMSRELGIVRALAAAPAARAPCRRSGRGPARPACTSGCIGQVQTVPCAACSGAPAAAARVGQARYFVGSASEFLAAARAAEDIVFACMLDACFAVARIDAHAAHGIARRVAGASRCRFAPAAAMCGASLSKGNDKLM